MDISIKALHKNVFEWMAGPAGTIILHILVILAAFLLVDLALEPDEKELKVEIIEVDIVPIDEPIDLPTPENLPPMTEAILPPIVDIDAPPPPDITDFTPSPDMFDPPMLAISPDTLSPFFLKGLNQGQMINRSGDGRALAGSQYGGPWAKYAEVAVQRALRWLKENQNPDGSWAKYDKEAMTALAILTYLAHGEITTSPEYGDTVERAIRYLVMRQNDKGHFANVDTTSGTYSQAICVYAISEAYGMTRITKLKGVMEKGVQVLIDGQQSKGGYDYRFAKGARRDTSLAGWCCQAMKAAYIAGADNKDLKVAMGKAVEDMKSAQRQDNGSFYYTDKGSHSTHSMAAVAVLSLQLLGHANDAETRKGLQFLAGAECKWDKPSEWPMYAWYYIAQTKFHQGGSAWTKWNAEFAPQFIRNQNDDGSWTSPGVAYFPTGTTGRENYSPQVYATTLAALSLQVYYRFLPTYQSVAVEPVTTKADTDVVIQIL